MFMNVLDVMSLLCLICNPEFSEYISLSYTSYKFLAKILSVYSIFACYFEHCLT